MTCHEFWNEMPELADGGELPGHARECPSCAILLERQRAVAAGLNRISRDARTCEAPPRVEQRLLKAFRVQAGGRPERARRNWGAWAAAAAVVLVSVSWIVSRPVKPTGPAVPIQAMADLGDSESSFIPLPYDSGDLAAVPEEDADLVRVEVPRAALVALGLPVALGGPARVEAEVALGADGMLEGIRIMQ
jgi:hypothetical protein